MSRASRAGMLFVPEILLPEGQMEIKINRGMSMFKKFISAVTAGCVILWGVNAMALGIGGYMTVGGGKGKFDHEQFELYTSNDLEDASNVAVGAGVVFDTNTAMNKLFNYRVKIGFERNWVERETEMKLARFHIENSFGFGVVRNRWIRFWVGPTFGCSYTWGDRDKDKYNIGIAIPNIFWNAIVTGDSLNFVLLTGLGRDRIKKINYGGIDFGFVVGLNINVVENLTFGPELGFKYGVNWGTQDREVSSYVPIAIPYLIPLNAGDSERDLKMNGFEFYTKFSVMYRFAGDKYRG